MKKFIFSLLALLLTVLPAQASLWQYYNGNLPSISDRGQLAYKAGIVSAPELYTGSYEQNLALEQALRNARLGGSAGIPITDYETTLTQPLTSTATTIYVASVTTTDGHVLTTADIAPAIYLVLDPNSDTKKEIISCTGISSTTFTGCTRGLAFYGTETSVAANKKTHSAGSRVILSDVHYLFVSLNAEQTWSSIQTYSVYPVYSSPTTVPTTTGQFATKYYVDQVGAGGATASNVGDGHTLRANGTVPETFDVNTSTDMVDFILDDANKFTLATTTGSRLDQDFDDQWNATSTHPGLLMSTSTIMGNFTVNGNATSTGSMDIGGLCFSGTSCVTSVGSVATTSQYTAEIEAQTDTNLLTYTLPAGFISNGNVLILTTFGNFVEAADDTPTLKVTFNGVDLFNAAVGMGNDNNSWKITTTIIPSTGNISFIDNTINFYSNIGGMSASSTDYMLTTTTLDLLNETHSYLVNGTFPQSNNTISADAFWVWKN